MRTTIVIGMMALMAGVAGAAVVTIDLVPTSATSFDVMATVSTDNAGLQSFCINFGPNVLTLANDAPQAPIWDGSDFGTIEQIGFSLGRAPNVSFPLQLAAAQDITKGAAYMVFDVGQLPGPAAWPAAPFPNTKVYLGGVPAAIPAPTKIGHGTCTNPIAIADVTAAGANVFDNDSGVGNTAATVDVVPEPATMSILVIGGLGMLLRRRR